MPRKAPMCKICHTKPAEVPDRNRSSATFRREVCKECHADRLKSDLKHILVEEMQRRNQDGKEGSQNETNG